MQLGPFTQSFFVMSEQERQLWVKNAEWSIIIMYNDTDLSGENIVLCNTEHCFYVDFRLCFVFKNIFKV